ncbi:conjugal transfer protein TraN [Vibrio mediterranei]|nr:conjugal transfer protein TraN [Vibrio mediterranei]
MKFINIFLLTIAALVCSTASAAPDGTCTLISHACTEGPETRLINGVSITRDCWKYEDLFWCETGEYYDRCSALDNVCQVTSSVCTDTHPITGSCVKEEKIYQCGAKLPESNEATLIDSTYTITNDSIDTSACTALENNDACTQTGDICVEGPETRIINGKAIHKECWKWEKEYACIQGQVDNYCSPLQSVCTEVTAVCNKKLWDGSCAVETKTYDCDLTQPNKDGIKIIEEKVTIIKDELNETDCDDERAECVLIGRTCVEGAETRMINGAPIYKDCWRYKEEYSCLSDNTASTCDTIDQTKCTVSKTECLVTGHNGICTSTAYTYTCQEKTSDKDVISCGDQIFCMGDDCYDTSYEPNNEFGLAAAYLNAAVQAGTEVDSEFDIDIFTAHKSTCTQYPLNTVDCCDDSGWANGSITGCSNEDKALISERKAKLTHFVGTYCSKELPLFGTCIEYKQSYCTYSSMLARLVQEGGRLQLGRGWGSAENPDCKGMTPDELVSLDFTKIDFTEYIEQLQTTTIDTEEIAKKVEDKINGMVQP